jgi:septal ring factor EnvC (AmiA/AmiB activator)
MEIDARAFGRLESTVENLNARIGDLEKSLDKLQGQINDLTALLNQARGARWLFAGMIALAGFLAGIAAAAKGLLR